MQQYRELHKRGHQAPNPRNQFLADLTKHILQLHADGHNILQGMDANLKRPDRQFAKFLDTCGLHDMLAEKYPDPTATHAKQNRLDLVLGDDFVSSNVEAISILDSSHGSTSDHAYLYVDLNRAIFDKQLADPTAPSQRAFRIHDTVKLKKSRKILRSSLDRNPQLQALDEELTTVTDPERIETLCNDIDTILTTTILEISETVRRKVQHSPPWSLMYRDSRKDAISWNQILRKMLKTKQILILIPSQVTSSFNGALQYAKDQVKQAWKKLNQIKRNAFPHRVDFLRERIKKNTDEHKPDQAAEIRKMLDKEIR